MIAWRRDDGPQRKLMRKQIRYTAPAADGHTEYEIDPSCSLTSLMSHPDASLREWAGSLSEASTRAQKPSPVRVLVIEDDKEMANLLSECLSRWGYRPLCAFGGLEGLDMAKTFKPAVIILDMMMPDMHGYLVCQAIRECEELHSVKVLISTAKRYPPGAAGQLGGDAMLLKPYSPEDLRREVQKLLGPSAS